MGKIEDLQKVLTDIGKAAIAVSGGVDSLTLASFAYKIGARPVIVHGISPAVPKAGTSRVRDMAKAQGWRLKIVDAGEFGDPNYKSNPVNRCYFCKSNLYATIASLAEGIVLSGANLDDLSDYRPGLDAAREHQVRHPFIESKMDKAAVRTLARQIGLSDVAELPASPCLASRVETGIVIDPAILAQIDRAEAWLRAEFPDAVLRCRYRRTGWVLELDPATLATIEPSALKRRIARAVPELADKSLEISSYRRGSAFLRPSATS